MTKLINQGGPRLEKMVKGATVIIILLLISTVFGFVFRVLAARWLGPYELGIYALAETVLGLAVTLSGLGIIQGISRYLPYYRHRDAVSLAGYYGFTKRWPLATSVLVGFGLIILAPWLTHLFALPANYDWMFKVLGIILPLRIYSEINRRYLLATDHWFWGDITYFLVEKVLLVLGVIVVACYRLTAQGLVGFLASTILISALIDGFLWWWLADRDTATKLTLTPRQHQSLRWEWLLFSWPLWLTALSSFILSWGDNLVISRMLGPTQVGFYAAAFALATFLDFFQKMIAQVFLPTAAGFYAENNYQAIDHLYGLSATATLILTMPIAWPLILWPGGAMVLIYGQQYQVAAWSLMILSIGYVINVAMGLAANVLIVQGRTKIIIAIYSLTASLNVLLNVVFANRWGITGVAIATALVMALTNILTLVAARRAQLIHLPWSKLGRILAAAALATVWYWPARQGDISWPAGLLVLSLALIIYVAMLFLFRVVNLGQLKWYQGLFLKPKKF